MITVLTILQVVPWLIFLPEMMNITKCTLSHGTPVNLGSFLCFIFSPDFFSLQRISRSVQRREANHFKNLQKYIRCMSIFVNSIWMDLIDIHSFWYSKPFLSLIFHVTKCFSQEYYLRSWWHLVQNRCSINICWWL